MRLLYVLLFVAAALIGRTAPLPPELEALEKKAEAGDADAQWELGDALRFGRNTVIDHAAAAKWYAKAAEQNHPKAQYALSGLNREGLGVARDVAKADQLVRDALPSLKKLAEADDVRAQLMYGDLIFDGIGIEQDKVAGLEWFKKAADQGYARAIYILGYHTKQGDGTAPDEKKAEALFAEALKKLVVIANEKNDAAAQNLVGLMHSSGWGTPPDHAKAIAWYKKAAEKEHTSAQFNIGIQYVNGRGVLRDGAKAVEWYQRAAKHNHLWARYYLGRHYKSGEGVKADVAKANEYFQSIMGEMKELAGRNQPRPQFALGYMHRYGYGVESDMDECVKWYRKAAAQNYASAKYSLGTMYLYGQGIPKDAAQGMKLLNDAAKQGHSSAQYYLSTVYANGRANDGVAQDQKRALELLQEAAKNEHTSAQYALAQRYTKGQGVQPSDEKAIC